jgi:hypothetical protein
MVGPTKIKPFGNLFIRTMLLLSIFCCQTRWADAETLPNLTVGIGGFTLGDDTSGENLIVNGDVTVMGVSSTSTASSSP